MSWAGPSLPLGVTDRTVSFYCRPVNFYSLAVVPANYYIFAKNIDNLIRRFIESLHYAEETELFC